MSTQPEAWLTAWRRYLGFVLVANLLWEIAQLPLYTIWSRPLGEQILAAAHCTLGDVLIAMATLMFALIFAGDARWPAVGGKRVLIVTTLLGVAYTIFSEWLNIVIRQSWAYSDLMPRIPGLGTGLSPLLQWVLLPPLSLWFAYRRKTSA